MFVGVPVLRATAVPVSAHESGVTGNGVSDGAGDGVRCQQKSKVGDATANASAVPVIDQASSVCVAISVGREVGSVPNGSSCPSGTRVRGVGVSGGLAKALLTRIIVPPQMTIMAKIPASRIMTMRPHPELDDGGSLSRSGK